MQNSQQATGYYRFHAGDIEVICISDGTLSTDINAVVGMSVEQAPEMFDASHSLECFCLDPDAPRETP